MKTLSLIIALFFAIQLSANEEKVTLTVKITNIQKIKGQIEIGFYNNPDKFPEEDGQYLKLRIKVTENTMLIKVKLPKGIWAVALYQDFNNDMECNRNFFGIPKEPYAFSNNIRPFLSAPSFDKCKFKLYTDRLITIKLID